MRLQALGSSGSIDLSVDRSSFVRNRSGSRGTGIEAGLGTTLSLMNSFFYRNVALIPDRFGTRGAVVVEGGNASLTNVTLSRNRSGPLAAGSGICVSAGTVTLTNVIAWGNDAGSGGDLVIVNGGTVSANYCDIGEQDVASGVFNDLGGNIDADPLLTIPGPDAHLTAASPAIDAGTCTGVPATDIDGDSRPTGRGCDIGADEFVR